MLFLKLLSLLARSLIDVARVASRHKRPSLLHAALRHPRNDEEIGGNDNPSTRGKKSQNTQKNDEAHGETRV